MRGGGRRWGVWWGCVGRIDREGMVLTSGSQSTVGMFLPTKVFRIIPHGLWVSWLVSFKNPLFFSR